MRGKNTRVVIFTLILVAGMSVFGYALVPLYNVFCKVTGLNGKITGAVENSNANIDQARWVTVEFITTANANLPWKFYPLVKKIRLHPGENKRVAFYVENDSNHTMTIQAIPSVSPGPAANYLKKTECFCFRQQTLKSGEAMDLPVIFHMDPELPQHINTVTLSYTLFDITGLRINSKNTPGRIS